MAYLEIVMGTMFAGKTTRLIETAKKAAASTARILVINHVSDTRYSSSHLSTHDRIEYPCLFLENLGDAWEEIRAADAIFINEAQFFDDLYIVVAECLAHEKSVYVYGLDGDYLQRPIGDILRLIPLCNSCVKLTASCGKCDGVAIYTIRLCGGDQQILVGQKEYYMPMCRACAALHTKAMKTANNIEK